MRSRAQRMARWGVALCLVAAASSCGGDPQTTADSTDDSATDSTTAGTSTAATTTATTPASLFEQATDPSQPEAQTSQIAQQSQFPPTIVVDDFSLDEGATVVGVSWQGIYCIETPAAPSSAPTASGFVIGVYPDVNGGPGLDSPLVNASLDIAEVNQTLLDTRTDLTCGSVVSTWDFYEYAAVLPTGFTAEPGMRYWISVQAVTPTYETFWAWMGSPDGDRHSLQEYSGNVTTLPVDRAFVLTD